MGAAYPKTVGELEHSFFWMNKKRVNITRFLSFRLFLRPKTFLRFEQFVVLELFAQFAFYKFSGAANRNAVHKLVGVWKPPFGKKWLKVGFEFFARGAHSGL